MKIRLILLEGKVEDLVKKYPKLQNLYNQGLLNNIKPAYVEWIAKQNEPPEDVIGLIPAFEKNIQRLSVKDINRYTSEQLTLALEQLSTKKAPEQIQSEDSTILGQFGPWLVVMPHTTESSCHWGSGTTWCTARTTSQNLFLSYVARKNQDIVLYYIMNSQTNDNNSKISIGFVNGEPLLSGESGGVTVDAANKGLNESDLKNILGEHYDQIMNTLVNHSNSIGGKHPAKKEMEILAKNPVKLKKHLSKFKDEQALQDFMQQVMEYDPTKEILLIISQTLDYLAKKTNDENTLNGISYDENTSSETLDVIAKKTDNLNTLNNIAYHKNVSPQTLDYLAKNTPKLSGIGSNTNAWPETLDFLAKKTDDMNVLSRVASNTNASPETLDFLAKKTNDMNVLVRVASNRNTSPETLDYIAKNIDNIDTLYRIANNRNTSPETLRWIIKNIKYKENENERPKSDIYSPFGTFGKKPTNKDIVNKAEQNLQNRNIQQESKIKLKINLSKLI